MAVGLVGIWLFWLLNIVAAGGEEFRRHRDDLSPSSATLLVANVAFLIWAGFVLLSGDLLVYRGFFLVLVALAQLGVGGFFIVRDGERNLFGLLAMGTGVAALTMADRSPSEHPRCRSPGPRRLSSWPGSPSGAATRTAHSGPRSCTPSPPATSSRCTANRSGRPRACHSSTALARRSASSWPRSPWVFGSFGIEACVRHWRQSGSSSQTSASRWSSTRLRRRSRRRSSWWSVPLPGGPSRIVPVASIVWLVQGLIPRASSGSLAGAARLICSSHSLSGFLACRRPRLSSVRSMDRLPETSRQACRSSTRRVLPSRSTWSASSRSHGSPAAADFVSHSRHWACW